jgi:hypothetical protein
MTRKGDTLSPCRPIIRELKGRVREENGKNKIIETRLF